MTEATRFPSLLQLGRARARLARSCVTVLSLPPARGAGMIRALALLLALAGPLAAEPVAGAGAAIGAFRAEAGLAPLDWSPALQAAAEAHAADLARRRVLSHQGGDGSSAGDRARRAGYGWCLVAENLAWGQRDLAEVMQGWAGSPGHRANLLAEAAQQFGLARAQGHFWVLVIARPGC